MTKVRLVGRTPNTKPRMKVCEQKILLKVSETNLSVDSDRSLVKDARSIHKTIRDAIMESQIYYRQLEECYIALEKSRAAYLLGQASNESKDVKLATISPEKRHIRQWPRKSSM